MPARAMSSQTLALLRALAAAPTAWRPGSPLCRAPDLTPGSCYPILMRLADRGLLETSWETEFPPGRPPRHLYRLSPSGLRLAAEHAPAPSQQPVGLSPARKATP